MTMNKKTMLTLAATTAIASTCMAAVKSLRVVANEADKANPGWENAYVGIADAVAALNTHGSSSTVMNQILVAPGTYSITETLTVPWAWTCIRSAKFGSDDEEDRESTIFDGGGTTSIMNITQHHVFISGVTFANGFKNSETYTIGAAAVRTGNYGTISNCVFRGNVSTNVYGTCIYSGYAPGTQIVGCIFTNNSQTITISGKGVDGCAIWNRRDVPTVSGDWGLVKDCLFDGNMAEGESAMGSMLRLDYTIISGCTVLTNSFKHTSTGKEVHGGYAHLVACRIDDSYFSCIAVDSSANHAVGSVLKVTGTGSSISNCTFAGISDRTSTRRQGTICVEGASTSIVGCRFIGNDVYQGSGFVMQKSYKDLLIRNCIFSANTTYGSGCSLIKQNACKNGMGVRIENCTFADNSNGYSSDANEFTIGYINSCSSLTNYFVNNVFTEPVKTASGITTVVSNCCLTALLDGPDDANNFTIEDVGGDLRFVDAANGDYHLQVQSPLYNKGTLLDWMTADAVDIDGNTRVFNKVPDIGCYECQLFPPGMLLIIW